MKRAPDGYEWPWRRVAVTEPVSCRYNARGTGLYRFMLTCGHTHYQKRSAGRPEKKRCDECAAVLKPRPRQTERRRP